MGNGAAVAGAVLAASLLLAAEKPKKPAKEALKELALAIQLLDGGQVEEGAEKLRVLIANYPDDPAAKKAGELLIENGIGEEIRVVLVERKVFREAFKIPEKDVLDFAQNALKVVRKQYEGIEPVFTEKRVVLHFYDSQARFRQAGGSVTSSGHFDVKDANLKEGSLEGNISWHFPRYAATQKDRLLSLKGTLYHEMGHYENAVRFGGALPYVLDEGIAEYLESRLNTEYYQYYRETDRERIESDARNGVNAILKFADFTRMLEGARGFGQGDVMISRWYSLCYALVDFFERGEIEGKKASYPMFLREMARLTRPSAKKKKEARRLLSRMAAAPTLTKLVKTFYDVDLERFHQAFVRHVMTYKQR